jgi:twitching motility protein PilT
VDLTQLLAFTIQNNASDLHLSAGSPPVIRVSGSLKRVKANPLDSENIRTMLYSVMTDAQRADFEETKDLDFAISLGEKSRFRVNAFVTRIGASAVFRVIPTEIPSMEDLDLPLVLNRVANLSQGLVLVTGATGSGKSTTIASMIDHINRNHSKHILTIEDPVEFFHTSQKSLVNHREVGEDTADFASALKSALREDPDVIFVGEMRDYETISLALTAAETGHLVFGTLHSNSAPKTIDRIVDVFPAADKDMVRTMLASSLQAIVSQNLMARADGEGRVGAFEILLGTNAVRNLIRENQITQIHSMIQTGSRHGMTTMEESIKNLLESNLVTQDEANRILLQSSDENSDIDGGEGKIAASLGGEHGAKGRGEGSGLGAQKSDGEYSF